MNKQASTSDRIILENGEIELYRRLENKTKYNPKPSKYSLVYQCKIKLPKTPRKRFSTGQTNRDKAIAFGYAKRAVLLGRQQSNLSLDRTALETLLSEWLEREETKLKRNKIAERTYNAKARTIRNLQAYFIVKRGFKEISQINEYNISRYIDIRYEQIKSIGERFSGDKRITEEIFTIRSIFKLAVQKREITKDSIPNIILPEYQSNRRENISTQEWENLINKGPAWAKKAEISGINAEERYYRPLVFYFCLLMGTTGARPEGLYKVKWEDILFIDLIKRTEIPTLETLAGDDIDYENIFTDIYREEKKHSGWCQTKKIGAFYLQWLYRWHIRQRGKVEVTGLIFPPMNGNEPIEETHSSFTALRRDIGIDMTKTMYSFRHMYATDRLYEGWDIRDLSANMLTTYQMIERHYGHVEERKKALEREYAKRKALGAD